MWYPCGNGVQWHHTKPQGKKEKEKELNVSVVH